MKINLVGMTKGMSSTTVAKFGFASFFLLASQNAFALKMSEITRGWQEEGALIVPVILFLIAAVGVIFASLSVISAISTKKQDRPLTWQVWGLVGGAVAVVVPVMILALSGSLTGGEGDATGMMNQMNLGI